jgi:hypothetical protein
MCSETFYLLVIAGVLVQESFCCFVSEVLIISLFHQYSLQRRHIFLEIASSVFTVNTIVQRRILMTPLDTNSSSALMCGQGFLVNVW